VSRKAAGFPVQRTRDAESCFCDTWQGSEPLKEHGKIVASVGMRWMTLHSFGCIVEEREREGKGVLTYCAV